MNNVLFNLCRHCVNIMDGWYPFLSICLSKICELSLYKTRKELKALKETEEYKKAYAEEADICKKAFGIDI